MNGLIKANYIYVHIFNFDFQSVISLIEPWIFKDPGQ